MGSLANINFIDYGIINFSPSEIQKTGARLEDVKLTLLVCLQGFRSSINRPVSLLLNGMTTGNHVSVEHRQGLAVDFTLSPANGAIDIRSVVVLLIRSGFNGIGVKWNGSAYSFHVDLRPIDRFAVWRSVKPKKENHWTMKTIVGNTLNQFDPKGK